jgi:amino acid transporter
MSKVSRGIVGLIALFMLFIGFLLMGSAAGGDTLEGFIPVVVAILGVGLVVISLFIYNNVGNEQVKDLLKENNELLRKLIDTNIEIARRQHQAEQSRQTQSLLSREK